MAALEIPVVDIDSVRFERHRVVLLLEKDLRSDMVSRAQRHFV